MLQSDLRGFFSTRGFAEPATLTVNGVASSLDVIFEDAYLDPMGDFADRAPTAWLPTAAGAIVPKRDTLALRSTTYTIVEVRPDGTGVTQLRLRT